MNDGVPKDNGLTNVGFENAVEELTPPADLEVPDWIKDLKTAVPERHPEPSSQQLTNTIIGMAEQVITNLKEGVMPPPIQNLLPAHAARASIPLANLEQFFTVTYTGYQQIKKAQARGASAKEVEQIMRTKGITEELLEKFYENQTKKKAA